MFLPLAAEARIDGAKINGYLLNSAHPDGAAKAEFFMGFGFTIAESEILIRALQAHATSHPVSATVDSPFGRRYSVDGPLDSPDGRNPLVRTVWIIDKENPAPRLITAYPLRKRES